MLSNVGEYVPSPWLYKPRINVDHVNHLFVICKFEFCPSVAFMLIKTTGLPTTIDMARWSSSGRSSMNPRQRLEYNFLSWLRLVFGPFPVVNHRPLHSN
jgi:hypothetical protein